MKIEFYSKIVEFKNNKGFIIMYKYLNIFNIYWGGCLTLSPFSPMMCLQSRAELCVRVRVRVYAWCGVSVKQRKTRLPHWKAYLQSELLPVPYIVHHTENTVNK